MSRFWDLGFNEAGCLILGASLFLRLEWDE